MTINLFKHFRFLPILSLLLVLAAGCSAAGNQAPTAAVQTQGSTLQAAASQVQSSTAPASTSVSLSKDASVQLKIDLGPGPFNLPDPGVGLSGLASYTATLTLSFDGTNNSQPVKWSRTYIMHSSKTPAAHQLTIQTSGAVTDTDQEFMAEVDGVVYEQKGKDPCSAAFSIPGNSLSDQYEPARYLSFVLGADAAAGETVNAVPAKAYTFDQRALAQQNLAQSTGKLWVAAPGDYLVRYLLTTKGTSDYFGAGVSGTLTLDYELTDIGKPFNIQLPEGCPGGVVSIPPLADATNVFNNPGALSYDTSTSLTDAAAYYQKQASSAGWTQLSEPDISPTGALMEYAQGDQTMTITISTNAGISTVNIFIIRGQPTPAAPSSSTTGTPFPPVHLPPIPSLQITLPAFLLPEATP